MNKKGSATLVVIIFSIIYMLYTASTYADVRHMKRRYEEYEQEIKQIYEQKYESTINNI